MKTATLAILLMAAAPAYGQTIKLACVSPTTCQFITDPFDLAGPQPTLCKLYKTGATTPLVTSSVTAAPPIIPGAPAGSVACIFAASFAPGSYSIEASSSRTGFSDSGHSLPYVFDSVAAPPLQTPTNLHPRNVIILP